MRNKLQHRCDVLRRGFGLRQPLFEALQRTAQTFIAIGLEYIVYGASLESLHRILVVGGDKNDMGLKRRAVAMCNQVSCNFDSGHFRHLDVEKRQVWLMQGDGLQRCLAIADCRYDTQLRPQCRKLGLELG